MLPSRVRLLVCSQKHQNDALMLAARFGSVDMTRLLLAHGADMEAVNVVGARLGGGWDGDAGKRARSQGRAVC